MKTNYIIIKNNGFRDSGISIKSDNTIFLDYLIMSITDEFISFKRPSLDYRGKVNKLHKCNNNYFQTTVPKIGVEGTFYFEGDEDNLIAYFRAI